MMRTPLRWGLELLLALALVCITVWLVTRFVAVPWAVAGRSMSPTLEHGDRVIVDLWTYRGRPPRSGEIALFDGPRGLPMVKRVADRPPPARVRSESFGASGVLSSGVWVLGDNPDASSDSRTFGAVPQERFRGRLVWRYWPLSRAGPIR
jgi:signal peptidase I